MPPKIKIQKSPRIKWPANKQSEHPLSQTNRRLDKILQ
jgi:hypothetical protein